MLFRQRGNPLSNSINRLNGDCFVAENRSSHIVPMFFGNDILI